MISPRDEPPPNEKKLRLAAFALPAARAERLGDAAARRIEHEGLYRTVCDYIAGMTDRYLLEEHARLATS